jgi:transketolase
MNDKNHFEQRCINTIRFLAVDMIEKARSGHPGICMGMAPAAYVLWTQFLRHSPSNPSWTNRDRFVLSAGHGSALLYALLHLTGYSLPLDELRRFRQWGSMAPGHPEYGHTPGVEATTGPLGQGLGMAVGMAMAEVHLAARFNTPGHAPIDHFTYVIASDGDLMEGVGAEASALAGHLGLGKLIVLFDSNHISLAGSTSLCFTEDVSMRYRACGWHVQRPVDGKDIPSLKRAIAKARKEKERPSLIIVRTVIGDGAPKKQGTFEAHGSPLGSEEAAAAKKSLGWPVEPDFLIEEDVLKYFRFAVRRGKTREAKWEKMFKAYTEEFPDRAAELQRMLDGGPPGDGDRSLEFFHPVEKGLATRKASETVMQKLAAKLPGLIGGSADLNPSTTTWLKTFGDFEHPGTRPADTQGAVGAAWDFSGRNIHYGVREHAMGSISNGMALHGGLIPYASTFLIFSDYMRPAIRLAALMKLRVVFIFTHDSIGVGEDGPTHQPIEQILSLRAIPGLTVLRPADANETLAAWRIAVGQSGPAVLVLTRQNLPVLDAGRYPIDEGVPMGAYTLAETGKGIPDILLAASGSEVHLALGAMEILSRRGVKTRVISMPSWEIFAARSQDYRNSVFPPEAKARLAIEAGSSLGWWKWVGEKGDVIGVDRFGASAPGPVVMEKYGFTVEKVVERAFEVLKR